MSKFLLKYFKEYANLIQNSEHIVVDLNKIKNILITASAAGNKAIIVGNGASAAIASHVAVDFTKSALIKCVNFNESGIITCFANDYGYEHWVEHALNFYGEKGDVLIAISSSGASMNIINGCTKAREMDFYKVVTLSGMSPENMLRKSGDVNLWVDCDEYNHIENMHQFWLLAIVESIIADNKNQTI